MNRPLVKVGLLTSKTIRIILHGQYRQGNDVTSGTITLNAGDVDAPLLYKPCSDDCYVEVKDVTIGINFHWERTEDQMFRGDLYILPNNNKLVAINILPIEEYLESVISSEMKATSQIELLKAHAVISRSWLMAQIEYQKQDKEHTNVDGCFVQPGRIIRWYGHADHKLFDVCADDHCQRYQGISRQTTPEVAVAVHETAGEVLRYEGKLCDTRFSKCCGGVFERFEACWEDEPKGYLVPRHDYIHPNHYPDLTNEEKATEWIMSSPVAFCNTRNRAMLSQVLNGYDLETTNFYRWTQEYTTEELSELVNRKSGIDFGTIQDMVPIERGTSGRIVVLKIIGDKCTMEIGKELEIRRILSESHLYSSAFVVEKTATGFRLTGAGWGHGVGLCQIGAAMMAHEGYTYREILSHYYPGSKITIG